MRFKAENFNLYSNKSTYLVSVNRTGSKLTSSSNFVKGIYTYCISPNYKSRDIGKVGILLENKIV